MNKYSQQSSRVLVAPAEVVGTLSNGMTYDPNGGSADVIIETSSGGCLLDTAEGMVCTVDVQSTVSWYVDGDQLIVEERGVKM